MSAARSARVICGACAIARYSAGSRASAARARARRASPRRPQIGSIASASVVRCERGVEVAASPSSSSPICASERRVGRIERDGLSGSARAPHRRRPPAVRPRRARDRETRCRASSRSPPGTPAPLPRSCRRAPPRAPRQCLARRRGTSARRRAARSVSEGIGGKRRLERREPHRLAPERHERLASSDERRSRRRRRSSARSKCSSAALGSLRASSR